jgi:nitrous oxide reductase accessory protein NosL
MTHKDAAMRETLRTILVTLGLLASVFSGAVAAGGPQPPTEKDRCEICGMYVHKYPNWVATIVFKDGSQVFFDGAKDFFRFILSVEQFGEGDAEIAALFVTDYYRVRFIDAKTAHFVVGSDVMGPMGGELVPHASREDAETFARDHGGEGILAFDDVTLAEIPK